MSRDRGHIAREHRDSFRPPESSKDIPSVSKIQAANVASPDVKHIVDLLSQRLLFYTQHFDAERKSRQLRSHEERWRNSDFQNASFLDVQCTTADLDKAKIAQKMSYTDAKLTEAMSSLLLHFEGLVHAKALEALSQQNPAPSASEISSDVVQRMDEMQKMFRKEMTDESQSLRSSIKADYETQIGDLQQNLVQERLLRTGLQNELQSLSARLMSIESKAQDQINVSAQLEESVKRDAFTQLESRLAKVEASNTPAILEAANRIIKANEAAASEPDTRTNVTPDGAILQSLESRFTAMQVHFEGEFSRITNGFNGIIEEEREQRELVNKKFDETSQTICAGSKDSEAIKAELHHVEQIFVAVQKVEACEADLKKLQTEHDKQSLTHKQYDRQLREVSSLLSSFKVELENMRQNLDKSAEAHSMRLDALASWQSNFNAKPLFDAIMQHLNKTLLGEHVSCMHWLKEKVSNLEAQVRELSASNKRRKLAAGCGPYAATTPHPDT